jgi:hypothetical protein
LELTLLGFEPAVEGCDIQLGHGDGCALDSDAAIHEDVGQVLRLYELDSVASVRSASAIAARMKCPVVMTIP